MQVGAHHGGLVSGAASKEVRNESDAPFISNEG